MKYQRTTLAKLVTLFASVAAMDAVAQPQRGSVSGLEEIVVTAQRRAESQQDVPIAITTQTADMLVQSGIESTQELGMVVPNLVITREGTAQTAFLRGIGNPAAGAGQEPSVAFYVDGVYNPNPTSATMAFNNIERVEVLKGPQGTLFGRNTTGGVVHVITKDPSHEAQGSAEVGVGNYDTVKGRFYGTTGLSDDLAADFAVAYENQDKGFGRNVTHDKRRRGTEDLALRSKWFWTPGDNTEVRASVSYSDTVTGYGLDRDLAPGAYGLQGLTPVSGWQDVGVYVFSEGRTNALSTTLHVVHQLDNFDLVSITSYRNDDLEYDYSSNGTALPAVNVNANMGQDTVTQEFQLVSSNDSNLQWMVGLYYFDSKAQWEPIGLTSDTGAFGSLTGLNVHSKQDSESYAVFGQATWSITDRTRLTFGGRWSKDDVELNGVTEYAVNGTVVSTSLPFAAFPGFDNTVTYEEPTYRIGIDHDVGENAMVYASYNRGYKTGVFNLTVTAAPERAVEPEIVDAYEIGFKSDLFDRRLRLNGALFYYDIKDLQLPVVVVGGMSTRNASAAEILGGELELNAVVTDRLSVHGAISVLDSEYKDFHNGPLFTPNPPAQGGNRTDSGDLSGRDLQKAPDFTFNASLVYEVPTEVGTFNGTLSYFYNDGFYWDSENRLAEPSYSVVNGQLSWADPRDNLKVTLWGKNLTDEEYTIYGFTSASGDLLAPAEPRTYGVTLGISF
ncbi:MAG: TonB-dependent receptor [Porticoccaceae bacterium]